MEGNKDTGVGVLSVNKYFNNKSGLEFQDISSEQYRTYRFRGGESVTIANPRQLHVSERGHRLFDAQGESHYIPFGWLVLTWKSRDGEPNFVK